MITRWGHSSPDTVGICAPGRLEKDVVKRARTKHDCRASLHEVQAFLHSHVRIGTIGGVLQSQTDRDLSLEPRRARPPAVPFDGLAKK